MRELYGIMKRTRIIIGLICIFLCVTFFRLWINKNDFGEVITITVKDSEDRRYDLFYDNGKKGYPFTDGVQTLQHEGINEKTQLTFDVPYGRDTKLRIDLYNTLKGTENVVSIYEIVVETKYEKKKLTAEDIYKIFYPYPDANVKLENDHVVISFVSDVLMFETTEKIPYQQIESAKKANGIIAILINVVYAVAIAAIIGAIGIGFNKLSLLNPNLRQEIYLNIFELYISLIYTVQIGLIQRKTIIGVVEWAWDQPKYFFLTIITLFIVLNILILLFKKIYAVIVLEILIILISFINEFKIMYRENPFFPLDVVLFGEVRSIADGLELQLDSGMIKAIIIFVGISIIVFLIDWKFEKFLPIKKGWSKCSIIKVGCSISVFYIFFFSKFSVTSSGFDPINDYEQKGVLVGFLSNIKTLIPPKMDGYSAERIEEIIKEYQGERLKFSAIESRPNIILIMSESFWDIEEIPGIEFEKEIFSNLKVLRENAVSGELLTSVYGGGTSVTEFEVLTGFSKQFLPIEMTPYYQLQDLSKPSAFSIAQYLKHYGYDTQAIHPFLKENYNRNVVYPNMGFDSFISSDDFRKTESLRSFISDNTMVDRIISEYNTHKSKSDDPFFQFAVSVQNHPDYARERWGNNETISVIAPALSKEAISGLEDLATGLYYSDQSLGRLIEYFSNIEDPTIIIMFGDHMSKLGNTVDEIYVDSGWLDSNYSNCDFSYATHRTPFIAWSNYKDIREECGIFISSFLLPTIFEIYDLRGPIWFDFLNDIKEICPGYSLNVALHNDAEYSCRQTELEIETYDKYELMQYDFLYGEKIGQELFLKNRYEK